MSDTSGLLGAVNDLIAGRIKEAILAIEAKVDTARGAVDALDEVIVNFDKRIARLEADAPSRVKLKPMTVGDLLTGISRLQLTPDMITEIVSMEVSADGLVVVKTAPAEPRKGAS